MLRYHVRVAHFPVVDWARILHRPPTASPVILGTGVLWVSTRTHPCGSPSRQDDGETRAPALHTLDDVLRFRGDEEYRAVLLQGVIAIFCNDVQILQCLASPGNLISTMHCLNYTSHGKTYSSSVLFCVSLHFFCTAHRKIRRPGGGLCHCKISILIFALLRICELAVQFLHWNCNFYTAKQN